MKSLISFFFICLLLMACGQGVERLQAEISAQRKKADSAKTTYRLEYLRLQELQDSLHINIQKNVILGIDTTRARALEQSRLNLQNTLVQAADRNLKSQEEYLTLLKKQLQNLK